MNVMQGLNSGGQAEYHRSVLPAPALSVSQAFSHPSLTVHPCGGSMPKADAP